MHWRLIADISAFTALLLSIVIFVQRLLERRRRIAIHFETTFLSSVSEQEDSEVLLMRIINVGAKPIVINKDSFIIACNNKKIETFGIDWIGLEKIPHPLNPRSSCEVSIFEDSFRELAGEKELSRYMNVNEYVKTICPLSAEFMDIKGRKYKSGKQYYYNFYINTVEFVPK
jgi:hypothetical protein